MEKIMALDKWHLVTDKVTSQDIKDELERKIVVQEKNIDLKFEYVVACLQSIRKLLKPKNKRKK